MSPEKPQTVPNPQFPVPSVSQLLLLLLLLSWLIASPIAVGIISMLLPISWPALATNLLATAILAGLIFAPILGLASLVRWRHWANMQPFVLALTVTAIYMVVAVSIRAVTEATTGDLRALPLLSESNLRLTVLMLSTLLIGGIGLWRAGVPKWMLPHAFGLDAPPLTGLLASLALVAIVSVGWPLTGALGDSWVTLFILLQALALALPEEILFRGAVLGIITFNFQHRKALAAFIAILIYVAFTPSQIVPQNDWAKLVLLFTAIPFALLLTELRALTGSIWAGILFAWTYRAAPLLFTDPRVELPLFTEPWQTVTRLWMVFGTGGLALLLWGGRSWLTPRWRLTGLVTAGLALAVNLILWGSWIGLWFAGGQPGFHNDGFLIIMVERADLSGAEAFDDLIARRALVRDRLIETAEKTQLPVREALEAAGLEYRPFYLINMVRVEGHHRRMNEFADLPGVARVMLNPNVRPYPQRVSIGYGSDPNEGQGIGWNISQTGADKTWAMGVTGQGIVVAGQDTGYDWQHPALQNAYRGYNGSGTDHTYNWHDAWSDAVEPLDDDHHGTHTMGTILGDDGQGNQIGMAPDARWIGCRNMRRGLGNPASYTDCMEFFLAPYPNGGDPFAEGDVSKAPHIINNSWGCPDIEGCDDGVLEPATESLRAAGIMMVVSAGNDGPACETVNEPPARYDDVFSVGATNRGGQISGFSSRGPVPDDPNALPKPDISAPGVNVRSSVPGRAFGTASGTSMAGPHVSGLVALLWSANPALIGRIDATEEIIRQTARPVEVNASCPLEALAPDTNTLLDELAALEAGKACACGEVIGRPNNVYGWGEIDAVTAVKLALEYETER